MLGVQITAVALATIRSARDRLLCGEVNVTNTRRELAPVELDSALRTRFEDTLSPAQRRCYKSLDFQMKVRDCLGRGAHVSACTGTHAICRQLTRRTRSLLR